MRLRRRPDLEPRPVDAADVPDTPLDEGTISRDIAPDRDTDDLEVRAEDFSDDALSTVSPAPTSRGEISEDLADPPESRARSDREVDDTNTAIRDPDDREVVTQSTPEVPTSTVPVGDDAFTPAIRDPADHRVVVQPTHDVPTSAVPVGDDDFTAAIRVPADQVVVQPTHDVVTAPVAVVDDVDRDPVGRSPAEVAAVDDRAAARVLKTPSFSLLAPIAGWLAAWGAAAVAAAVLIEVGVAMGFGFGIADGSVDLDTGFWAGLWTLVVQAGAFLFGGYVAGRMARVRGTTHAVAAWVVAMLATAADAIILAGRDGGSSILAPLRVPQWAGLDYDRVVIIPLMVFALGSLVAAILGGLLATGANRIDRRDGVVTHN